jgi:predicted CoA-substrate-specific enzyme activase
MRALGICCGASTIQAAQVYRDADVTTVEKSVRVPHEGNLREAFATLLASLTQFGDIDRICVTGRSFRSSVSLTSITEPMAVEHALAAEYPQGGFPRILISSGGESQLVYTIDREGHVASIRTGNKCASGTGEFFLQQIRRMGLGLDEAVAMAPRGTPHRIAGRCSVFCKSDCTHALNKGEPKENITSGLCLMMAEKVMELVKDLRCEHAAIVGGGTLNTAMVQFLRGRFARLDVPASAGIFEAYGAALWALENTCTELEPGANPVRHKTQAAFGAHPNLRSSMSLVDFKSGRRDSVKPGDVCILGLDVGSTTTKAVLMRKGDRAMLVSVYLRTNGNPVEASRNCYRSLQDQLQGTPVEIVGLGVTGSGRQIAALHALSDTVINEIIAHATAAAYFDPEVDTIFEIGGQDAKYTYLTGGVPSDYAMNEACSAGTGSFLEEAARETLNVRMEQIADLAMQGESPPNFRDECAAFISSDIKLAGQDGVSKNDILAGLVYSICLNYLNRVKGSRPIGRKVFMQGGVCYNRAVPMAMAALLKSPIIVPPEPGLMGAYGVALEVANRLDNGLAEGRQFDLASLIARQALRTGSFICAGGKEKCDRKCEIARIEVDGKSHAFGGACNRYYNLRSKSQVDAEELDLVALRQGLLYDALVASPSAADHGDGTPQRTVGLNRSFMTHSLFPLFHHFFHTMGFRVVLSESIDPQGLQRIEAAYCLPAQIGHGAFLSLLKMNVDYLFLPHIMQVPVPNVPTYSRLCVFAQGEPYYLRSTFREEIDSSTTTVLSPVLKMGQSYEQAEAVLVRMAQDIGMPAEKARRAFRAACTKQRHFERELQNRGRQALEYLDRHPGTFGIVLFGRPYNAFPSEANMGVPHKVASRGYLIIPHDMLPVEEQTVDKRMFWATGQRIMKAAKFVKDRENLFGFFITNFSCGPDSFILTYFRNLMGAKPSLTLELDQHTADAGIDTRVEAAIDIMQAYSRMSSKPQLARDPTYVQARFVDGPQPAVIASDGTRLSLKDPRVELIFPAMGSYGATAVAAILRRAGVNARALPTAGKDALLEGRKHASCKECLPYLVLTGSFLEYLNKPRDPRTVTLLFLPTGSGPCRLGQYFRALEQTIEKKELRNVAVMTLTDENGYCGMGQKNLLRAWQAIVTGDVFEDIRSLLTVAAKDRTQALATLDECWKQLMAYFGGRLSVRFTTLLSVISRDLSKIPLSRKPSDVPAVSLIGEYFVRKDDFSRMNIVDYLHSHGFMVRVAAAHEYLCYSNYVINTGLGEGRFSAREQFTLLLTAGVQEWWERRIKSVLAGSGLYTLEMTEVARTIRGVGHLINENFRGEAILTVGSALREIVDHSCGVIAIGPFGCMPSRVAEAILKKEMNVRGKRRVSGTRGASAGLQDDDALPFLSIETDGNPFPQTVEAGLEAFVLQARRLHEKLHVHVKQRRPALIGLPIPVGSAN